VGVGGGEAPVASADATVERDRDESEAETSEGEDESGDDGPPSKRLGKRRRSSGSVVSSPSLMPVAKAPKAPKAVPTQAVDSTDDEKMERAAETDGDLSAAGQGLSSARNDGESTGKGDIKRLVGSLAEIGTPCYYKEVYVIAKTRSLEGNQYLVAYKHDKHRRTSSMVINPKDVQSIISTMTQQERVAYNLSPLPSGPAEAGAHH